MSTIKSELLRYKNRDGRNIVGYLDYPNTDTDYCIVIPPGFGETKRDSLKLAYYLAMNGFKVIRYDATYHVGESQGDMIDATFGRMKDDLLSTIEYAHERFGTAQFGVIGSSLGARISIKAVSQDSRIRFFLGLVAVVDMRATIKAVYHQDVIGEILQGRYGGKTIDDVMGFEVNVKFAESAIEEHYHDLESTRDDLKKSSMPLVFIVAENDPWVKINDVKEALGASPYETKECIVVPNAMHQLNENPEAALYALRQIVISCKKYLCRQNISFDDVIDPVPEELSAQWLREEARLKNLLQKSLEGEKEFWEKYLNKFVLIHKSPDYREFLSQISGMLNIGMGEKVLDAGCGNGHFGGWLFEKMIEKIFKENVDFKDFRSIRYVGIDFVANSLKEAMRKHLNMTKRVYRELSLRDKYPIIKYSYILSDLEHPLPFPDDYFDKVCCNLVLSYVKDPAFSLRELMRVLRKDGKIIVSSMKPHADLSQIYRNFVDKTEGEEELEEARKLLSAAGRIKQKEGAGFYKFFSDEELKGLFEAVGAKDIAVLRTFSNQSNIIIGVK